jgi:hypothetical protein
MTLAEAKEIDRRAAMLAWKFRDVERRTYRPPLFSPAEVARIEAKCGHVPIAMHKMADASGKAWQHRDLAVLLKHVQELDRFLNSPGRKTVMAGLEEGRRRAASPPRGWRSDGGQFDHKAVRGPGARAFGHAAEELVEDWTDEFRDDDFDDDFDDWGDDDWDDDDD